ncbi:hypothetical protein DICSQDRAFT_171827 [Dichomitus squalens LYAD-421 SS1]|uniref:DUF6532 domain-containing protein n=1 Tax=Dichomitus squalens (strain LYAD-421) TaxID=732165 RepID=R7SUR0_DICSQ|nr:uncharacterized protein DICSQDRAFT_171827 [Dichomitus squalens LYAD-421 SS1]EJF59648.1 hypothetical protein DICSQDRAFT_171827 [Dichomitus squalens LYAD-421 SS1]
MPKRKPVESDSPTEEDEEEMIFSDGESTSTALKRTRKVSTKQQAINNEKAAKANVELEKYKKLYHAASKKLKKQRKAKQDDADAIDDDPDRLPPESEEEDEPPAISLRASIRRQASTPTRTAVTPRIRRREGTGVVTGNATPQTMQSTLQESSLSTEPAELFALPSLTSSESAEPASLSRISSIQGQSLTSMAIGGREGSSEVDTVEPADTTPADGSSLILAPFRPGIVLGSRPNASDYTDEVKDLLQESITRYYYLYICTENAFPDSVEQRTFAKRAWKAACAARKVPVPWALSDRMIRLIGGRKSNIHGDISDAIRDRTAVAYGITEHASLSAERRNMSLVTNLMTDGIFHHKTYDFETGTRAHMFQNKFIGQAIQIAFFGSSRTGLGFLAPDTFNPIPIPTIAFVTTVIHAHLLEWSTGRRLHESFSESRHGTHYKAFKSDLESYASGNNGPIFSNIRMRMYEKAFRGGGGIALDTHTVRVTNAAMEIAKAELEARTGLTDSEDELEQGH